MHYNFEWCDISLRKMTIFCDVTNAFSPKWHLRNERRNSILTTRHYPDLGNASDWLKQISPAARPIRSSVQVWVVTRHQTKYGVSVLVSQTSFRGETSGGIARYRLFSQASAILELQKMHLVRCWEKEGNYYEHEWSARAALVKRFLLLINAYNYTVEPR